MLLKLRNPWGNFEWKGDWGDESDKWTPELKEQVGFEEAADDGAFWFGLDDFVKYFGRVQICKIDDDSVFISEPFHDDSMVHQFTLNESQNMTFSIS